MPSVTTVAVCTPTPSPPVPNSRHKGPRMLQQKGCNQLRLPRADVGRKTENHARLDVLFRSQPQRPRLQCVPTAQRHEAPRRCPRLASTGQANSAQRHRLHRRVANRPTRQPSILTYTPAPLPGVMKRRAVVLDCEMGGDHFNRSS